MKLLQIGDKIDKMNSGEVIYTMVVTQVTEDRAFADIPGGSDPYEFYREHDGAVVRAVNSRYEGFVIHHFPMAISA